MPCKNGDGERTVRCMSNHSKALEAKMKKSTATLTVALALTLGACGGSTDEGAEPTMADEQPTSQPEEVTQEDLEQYAEWSETDDVLAWASEMTDATDLVEVEPGIAVSESERMVYGLDCDRVAELTEVEGAEYGAQPYETDEEGYVVGGGETGYGSVCRGS